MELKKRDVTVSISPGIHKMLKIYVAQQGITKKEFLEKIILEKLKEV